jgi:hypothetical protein
MNGQPSILNNNSHTALGSIEVEFEEEKQPHSEREVKLGGIGSQQR